MGAALAAEERQATEEEGSRRDRADSDERHSTWVAAFLRDRGRQTGTRRSPDFDKVVRSYRGYGSTT